MRPFVGKKDGRAFYLETHQWFVSKIFNSLKAKHTMATLFIHWMETYWMLYWFFVFSPFSAKLTVSRDHMDINVTQFPYTILSELLLCCVMHWLLCISQIYFSVYIREKVWPRFSHFLNENALCKIVDDSRRNCVWSNEAIKRDISLSRLISAAVDAGCVEKLQSYVVMH